MRRVIDLAARWGCAAALLAALIPLGSLLFYVTIKGGAAFSWSLFTELPKPVGEPDGGFGNAILGTFMLVGMACAAALPLGILAGIYVSEYGENRFARIVRFCADVLSGVPSIAIGIFVYSILVVTLRSFSALAGAASLAIIMLPTVMRTTEEILALVPNSLRESALALGVPRWRVILKVVLRAGAPGIATGAMLAIARAAGETAPLLFTAFGNLHWSARPGAPIASLPVQIYTYAVSPYEEWHRQAFAGALILVGLVLFLNVGARLATRTKNTRSH